MRSHVVCLAKRFLEKEPNEVVPTLGKCPVCDGVLTWGNVVVERQKRKRARLDELNITT